MKLIEDAHSKLLAKSMDVYAIRQKITAANIANIDTPGYKKLSVSFEEFLRRMSSDDNLNAVEPEIIESEASPILEDEMMEMADTQIRVQAIAKALRNNFEVLRSGITGRSQ